MLPPFKRSAASARPPIIWLAIAFVLLVCLSLIGMDGWRSWAARRNQLSQMQVASANMARAIAQHADDTFKEADTALLGLVERVQTDGSGTATLGRLRKLMLLRSDNLPQLHGLFVYDQTGHCLVHSLNTPLGTQSNADRDYFIHHRQVNDGASYIGTPVHSRSNGAWTLTLSRRINRADGSFAGVALATIEVEYFTRYYNSFDIGQAGAIMLLAENGTMLTRRPLLSDSIGKDMRQTTLFRSAASKFTGNFTAVSPNDGVKQQISFRHMEHFPLLTSVALSEQEILSEWLADTYLHTAGVAALIVLLGSLGVYLVRQIQMRVDAEVEILQTRDEMAALNQKLERLSLQDALTELANRRHFDIALQEEFRRAQRHAMPLALLMIDADHFKRFNDRYGHASGDDCLKQLSHVMKNHQSRPGDLAARYGGEEFCMIFPNTDAKGAMHLAEHILTAVRALQIEHSANRDGGGIVTVSIGVAACVPSREHDKPRELLQAADRALYAAKDGGRDRSALAPAKHPAVTPSLPLP